MQVEGCANYSGIKTITSAVHEGTTPYSSIRTRPQTPASVIFCGGANQVRHPLASSIRAVICPSKRS